MNDTKSAASDVRFVSSKPRSETVALDWPIELDGKVVETVTISRLSVAQVERFFAEYADLKERDPAAASKLQLPMCDVDPAVIAMLDDDDGVRVSEVIARFLPRRFQELASASPSASGGTSS